MQSRVPTIAREKTEEPDGETDPDKSTSSDDSSEDEKSLDEIIDAYAE